MLTVCSLSAVLSLGIASMAVAAAPEAEAVEIPLKEIWALDMPGTRDVRELSPKLTSTLAKWLGRRSDERGKAEACFVVPETGETALLAAANVLMNGAKPNTNYPGQESSLFFYSFRAPGYVGLESVIHDNGEVTLRFQVTTHQETLSTVHFALIPLGKLAAGELTLHVIEVDPEKPYSNRELTKRSVCKSCKITTTERATK